MVWVAPGEGKYGTHKIDVVGEKQRKGFRKDFSIQI